MASLTNVMSNYRSISTELTGRLNLKTTATSLAETIDQIDVTAFVPSGSILPFAGTAAPQSFLLCDGSAINRNVYNGLFKVIGTTYGSGDGSTTFNLPNLKGRIAVGRDSAQTEFDTLGETGGSKTHTLTISEMPAHDHNGLTQSAGTHNHSITDPGHFHTYFTVQSQGAASGADNVAENNPRPVDNTSTSTTGITINNGGAHQHVIDSQGGGQPHNNLQPYIVLNYIIKY